MLAATLAGCSAGYYLQAAAGQMAVLRARVPLEQVLADPDTPAATRRELLVADDALLFSRLELHLPASRSYHSFVDLHRPAVVWNVFAAPEFSLEPRHWCYPVAGCATYRGWFSEQKARQFAAKLARRGDDVFVGGVAAYSTLGWFADPILSTMLDGSDVDLAGVLFHELAHEKIFLPGDTSFNEGFATFVQIEGTERWLGARGRTADLCRFRLRLAREAQVRQILANLRADLATIYAAPEMAETARRQARNEVYDAARNRYAQLRRQWPGSPWFDGWFDAGLNNAKLVALASYADQVPAFRALLAREHGDLQAFYGAVRRLAGMDAATRTERLRSLAADRAAGQATDQAMRPGEVSCARPGGPAVTGSAAGGSGCRAGC